MATNDDLDDFFKKKDRKTHKHKKQSGLLTNNQELLKQLEIVTIATSAFKENLDLDDEDEELQPNEESVIGLGVTEEVRKHPSKPNKSKIPDNQKESNVLDLIPVDDPQQQDEWEDFQSFDPKYEQLRLKFSRGNNNNNDDDDNEYYDDENNSNNNDDNNDANNDRQQQKDKPVWKIDQIKQEKETDATAQVAEKTEEPPSVAPPKPAATASTAYRPPALRGGSSVTVVSGNPTRPSKKKEPNISSIDEFPTLGSAVNKK